MNYLIYDVETPNRRNDSICSCAWMLHDGTKELDFGYQLINPQAEFDLFNTRIHHICAEDVLEAPTFAEYWNSTLKNLFADSVIVAHSAHFDMSVTSKALSAAGLESPKSKYIDTMAVFRALLPGESYKLCDMAARYSIGYNQHNAGSDVQTLNAVLDLLRTEMDYPDYNSMFEAASILPAQLMASKESTRETPETYEAYLARIQAIIDDAKSKGVDLSDVHFSFHGDLCDPAIARNNGLDIIVEALGGIYHRNVSGKVDYFVCFDDIITGTVERAREIASRPSSNIHFIDTSAFLRILGYHTDSPDLDGPAQIRSKKQAEHERAFELEQERQKLRVQKETKRLEKAAQKAARENTKPHPRGRVVIQMSLDDITLNQYHSSKAAAQAVGIDPKCIRDAACGKQRSAAGYRWAYKDTLESEVEHHVE